MEKSSGGGRQRWASGWLHWDAEGERVKEPNRRLLEVLPKGIQWPEWSPDRKWIAFKTEGLLAIAQPDVVSMGRTWFMQLDEPPCGRIEEWAPDGKTDPVLYVRRDLRCYYREGTFSKLSEPESLSGPGRHLESGW